METTIKRLLVGVIVLLFVGTAGVVFWEMAYEPPERPDRATIQGLRGEVTVRWADGGVSLVEAEAAVDAMAAIGYAHGMERGWTAELRRRTALGTLAGWFGGGVLEIDRHARQLGFNRAAREAYRAMPDEEQQLLQAYVRGLNTALATERVHRTDEFVLLNVEPSPWEPWHPLAVERLLAWLSSPSLALPEPDADPVADSVPRAFRAFVDRDRLLRRWLHAHGFERSVAWTARAPDSLRDSRTAVSNASSSASSQTPARRRVLFQRHVTGASALPFFQEVIWTRPDGGRTVLTTVPGSLLFPAGTRDGQAWSLLLGSRPTVDRLPVDTTEIRHRYERLTTRGGAETLTSVRRARALGAEGSPTVLPFPSPPDTSRLARLDTTAVDAPFLDTLRASPSPHAVLARRLAADTVAADSLLRPPASVDSTWVVQWSGFGSGTDAGAWLRRAGFLPEDDTTGSGAPETERSFQIVDGAGLAVGARGQWTVLGDPAVVEPIPGGVFVGRTPWGRFQAAALRERVRGERQVRPGAWATSDSSLWAAAALPAFAGALDPLAGGPAAVRDAVTYLRNWNHVYDRASIGATLFDRWMRAYRRRTGTLPTAADSTFFGDYLRRRALVRAVDSLVASQGRDLRQWRWERVAPDRRFYPVFSADSLVDQNVASLARTRFAPLDRPGRGHPSALGGGPTLVAPIRLGPAPSSWEGWTDPGRTTLTVRRLRFDLSAFLARPLMNGRRPSPVRLDSLSGSGATVLSPPAEGQ